MKSNSSLGYRSSDAANPNAGEREEEEGKKRIQNIGMADDGASVGEGELQLV